jgi:hypothetical protein
MVHWTISSRISQWSPDLLSPSPVGPNMEIAPHYRLADYDLRSLHTNWPRRTRKHETTCQLSSGVLLQRRYGHFTELFLDNAFFSSSTHLWLLYSRSEAISGDLYSSSSPLAYLPGLSQSQDTRLLLVALSAPPFRFSSFFCASPHTS